MPHTVCLKDIIRVLSASFFFFLFPFCLIYFAFDSSERSGQGQTREVGGMWGKKCSFIYRGWVWKAWNAGGWRAVRSSEGSSWLLQSLGKACWLSRKKFLLVCDRRVEGQTHKRGTTWLVCLNTALSCCPRASWRVSGEWAPVVTESAGLDTTDVLDQQCTRDRWCCILVVLNFLRKAYDHEWSCPFSTKAAARWETPACLEAQAGNTPPQSGRSSLSSSVCDYEVS